MLLEFQWSSLAHESDVAELLQRIGIDIATVVLRRKRYAASRAECFDYKCKEHHTCGCRYALTVTFDSNGYGNIKSIEREHNAHAPRVRARVTPTREQRAFLENATQLGVFPLRIVEQMRNRNILGDLTLERESGRGCARRTTTSAERIDTKRQTERGRRPRTSEPSRARGHIFRRVTCRNTAAKDPFTTSQTVYGAGGSDLVTVCMCRFQA